MNRIAAIATLSLALLSYGQAAEPANAPEQQVLLAMKEIQTQQAQIAENQAKIDAKVVVIAEAVRVARIYSSRAGH